MSEPPAGEVARPAIVLVRPREEGNVGAVARAMANMGLSRLILVEPATAIGEVARARAVHAGWVLEHAERAGSVAEALAPFRYVAATTSGRGRAPERPWRTPRELATEINGAGTAPAALVFGPEASGLTAEELTLATTLVTIPATAGYGTLNLSQAVLVLAYEVFLASTPAVPSPQAPPPARQEAVEGLFGQLVPLLEQIGFARDTTFLGVLADLRALAARAQLTEREVTLLRGICRRAARAVK
ncbi:MAG TPA: TrmJ/YjtD family RNA methyltransferase [Thermoanaerobaculia bacterium]|nr:TrmJ/YjtD family RNA methyltransferase [Thermoanaerobaculia bacterium]